MAPCLSHLIFVTQKEVPVAESVTFGTRKTHTIVGSVLRKRTCSAIKPLRDHRGTKRVIFMQIPFKHFGAMAVFVLPAEAAPYVFTHIRSYNNTTETPATTAVIWHRAR